MKIKKKYLFVFGIIVIYFLLPHVEISANTDSIIEYGYILEFIDGYGSEGESTVKQMLEYLKGGKTFYKLDKRNIKFFISIILFKGHILYFNWRKNKQHKIFRKGFKKTS